MASSAAAAQPHSSPATSIAAEAPPLLTVVELPGKGRALVASQLLRAGEIVLRDSPILLYSAFPLTNTVSSSSSSDAINGDKKYCSYCFRSLQSSEAPISSLTPCFSCFDAIFCNSSCRAAAMNSSHAPWLCQTLARLRNSPPVQSLDQETQVQVRFLVSAYNLAQISPPQFRVLLSLHGGAGSNSTSSMLLHSLIASIAPPPPQSVPEFSPSLTEALLVRDKVNAFGLMEPFSPEGERSARAYGIYPKASFFNHDCLPNACRFDYVDAFIDGNTDVTFRMIHDVPQGREVCVSYFPVNARFPERQKRLTEDYGFTCECERCKIESNWSHDDDEEEEEGKEGLQGEDMMEEDNDEGMEAEGEDDFPHAFFFLKFMCNRTNCWGTLAPLPPSGGTSSNIMECSACGNLKNADEDSDGDS